MTCCERFARIQPFGFFTGEQGPGNLARPAKPAMMNLLVILVIASLVSFASSTDLSVVCSAISNPSCTCINSLSSTSSANVRCMFSQSETPSPLFANSSFASSITLNRLDLSENNLDRLPDDLFNSEAIDTLILRDNNFEVVPAVLKKLRAVKTLDLSFNALRSLSLEELAGVSGLQSLDVSSNKLTTISGAPEVGEVTKLQYLRELSLARNAITSLNDSVLSSLTSLTSLDLAHNRLSQVTRTTFWQLRLTLQTLDLSNNSFSHVNHLAFQPLQRLHMLNLGHNDLKDVIGKLQFPQHLISLNLRNCGLTSINRCRLSGLTDLTVLDLQDNPLNCTCQLFFLHQRFQNQGSNTTGWSCHRMAWTPDDSSGVASPTLSSHTAGGGSDDGGPIAVADIEGQCQDSYAVCPSVSELVDQMVTTVNVDVSDDTLVVSWDLEIDDDLNIDGFQLRYIPEGKDSILSDVVPPDQCSLAIETDGVTEHFTVCLEVLMYTSAVVHQQCHSHQDEGGNSMVIGILAGVVFLGPCVVIMVVVFVKDNRIAKGLYQKISNGEDVEKQNIVSISDGKGERNGPQDSKDGPQSVSADDDANMVGVEVVQSAVVRETDGSRAQDSEAITMEMSPAKEHVHDPAQPVGSAEQPACPDPAPAEGVRNLGFLCQEGHVGDKTCADPEHESTHL